MGSFSHRLVQSWPADLFTNRFRTSEDAVTVCYGPSRFAVARRRPALVSLVFLHTFFGLAQFCKKPCNPVFNVLQFFKKIEERSADLHWLSFKTLRQNNAVLRRAALSGPKPAPNRARYRVFSASHCGRPSDRLYCTFQISQGPVRNSGG